jgi:hypothetical protein
MSTPIIARVGPTIASHNFRSHFGSSVCRGASHQHQALIRARHTTMDTPTPIQFDADESAMAVDAEGAPSSSSSLISCVLCPEPKSKGSACCPKHKKVSDNVYNDVKKSTGGTGEDWETFKDQKKRSSPEYLNMIVAATDAKEGAGRGKATATFNAIQHLKQRVTASTVRVGKKKAFKTFVGFSNHCKTEFGWLPGRCKQEWDYLKSMSPADDIKTTMDRLTGEAVEWLRICIEDYAMAENVTTEQDWMHVPRYIFCRAFHPSKLAGDVL